MKLNEKQKKFIRHWLGLTYNLGLIKLEENAKELIANLEELED